MVRQRLEVDLRFNAARGEAVAEGADRLDLTTLTRVARTPTELWRLLRARRYEEVTVVEGDLPLSSVQAACMVFVAAVPTRRFAVGGSELGKASFLVRALAKASVAVPSELLRIAIVAGRVTWS